MTKMTYVAALNSAIETTTDAAVVERLTALRDTLVKRAEKAKTAPHKPSKATLANAEMMGKIVDFLATQSEPLTSAEIAEQTGLDVRKVRGLIGRSDAVKAVRINSKLTKWAKA